MLVSLRGDFGTGERHARRRTDHNGISEQECQNSGVSQAPKDLDHSVCTPSEPCLAKVLFTAPERWVSVVLRFSLKTKNKGWHGDAPQKQRLSPRSPPSLSPRSPPQGS